MLFLGIFIIITIFFALSGRKKFLIYFMVLYPVLPDYFGIELGQGLPLLKANRILLIVMIFASLYHNKFKVKTLRTQIKDSNLYIGLMAYFILRIIANIYYIPTNSAAINSEFTIIVEQMIMMVVVLQMINTRSEINECVEALVKTSGVISVISIMIVFTGTNIFYNLNTISRQVLMASFVRMGIVRAEATFGHPVYFSMYLVLMLPLAFYLLENSRKKVFYGIILLLDIITLLLTETRGSILVFFILAMFVFLGISSVNKGRLFLVLLLLVLLAVIIFAILPNVYNQFSNIIQSVVLAFSPSETKIENFGGNEDTGLSSRLVQLSGITWTFMQNPIFGLGANCHVRGLLAYNSNGMWIYRATIDNALVQYIAQEGILGGIAPFSLFGTITFKSFNFYRRSSAKEKNMNKTFFLCFIAYIGEMFSIVDASLLLWIIIVLFIAYNRYPSVLVSDSEKGELSK